MSFGEKRSWIYAVSALVVSVVYFATVLGQVPGTDVTKIAYIRPMLTAIGVAVVLNIVASVVATIASPRDADKEDERDKEINRLGQHVGFYVVSVCALVPLGLAMVEAEHFWIANSLYLAFVVSAFTSSIVKIVAYRRGF
ncbi:hypothetical protein IMZ11_36620 [Microtetraspora sp. AC03309]|uniref:hypothetical protein n=1 Tax=Microtetraspora sp. AC03309 TaxID=2779376 RepID=UPI001E52210F|nr:hypothetical protein [Microtetraspora sp. AC03309]MCC5581149.1 hypothetical protein [Microtetraspora sp. AC03309]